LTNESGKPTLRFTDSSGKGIAMPLNKVVAGTPVVRSTDLSGKSVIFPASKVEVGQKVIRLTDISGKGIVVAADGGSNIPFSDDVDPCRAFTVIEDPDRPGAFLLTWLPGLNNDEVEFDFNCDFRYYPKSPRSGEKFATWPVQYDEEGEMLPGTVTRRPIRLFQWHYFSIWGKRQGKYSKIALHVKAFVTMAGILGKLRMWIFGYQGNLLPEGDFERGIEQFSSQISDIGSHWTIQAGAASLAENISHTGKNSFYGRYGSVCANGGREFGTITVLKPTIASIWMCILLPEGLEGSDEFQDNPWLIFARIGSGGQDVDDYVKPYYYGQWKTGYWFRLSTAILPVPPNYQRSYSFWLGHTTAYPPYGIGGTVVYMDDASVRYAEDPESWMLTGESDVPPNELYGSGVRVYINKIGPAAGVPYANYIIHFWDPVAYAGYIAFRLIDPDHGILEVWAHLTGEELDDDYEDYTKGLPREIYFGDIQLCNSTNTRLFRVYDYHGFLPISLLWPLGDIID